APKLRYGTANAPASWHRFVAMAGGSWQVAWDAATGVPDRIWGSGIAAPGASADPAIAERYARQVLADHLALLAPGASASDFELVSNTTDGDLRSVGFVQRAGGLRVVGGQLSFRFKRDRLFVIASQALPGVPAPVASARVARASVVAKAMPALRAAVQLPAAPVRAVGDDVVLPLVTDDAVLGYRVTTPLEIDGAADGRYLAYADPATGGIVAIHQLNEYAAGTVLYHGVDRWPGRGYVDRPAPRAHVTIDGAAQTTSSAGGVTWSSNQSAALVTAIVGDLVNVVNMSADVQDTASAQMTIAPGGSVTWDASSVLEDDAQVQAYLDTNLAKEYVRANVDAQMPTLDDAMTVNVNLNQECNAYFDGTALNFFHASPPPCKPCCNNTALLQDVNFHEYGHRVHTAEIIAGVGSFDGAMSEGAADFLAASITGDPGMGRGFEYTDDPLRQLDPPNKEYRWPIDIDSDIHATGLIFAGTFWDLRKAFIAAYGAEAGVPLTNKLYVAALRRATNIPSSLIEALAADDDDGDLSNGTPHECIIRDAFAAHGMRTATGTVTQPGAIAQVTLATGVAIDLVGASSCGTDTVSSVLLGWAGAHANPPAGTVMAQQVTPTHFVATLPMSPNGAVTYHASVTFADGNVMELADNLADPKYQAFDGPMIKLYCTDFEDGDPLAAGWTASNADRSPPTWAWVEPGGGATNPQAAFSGTHVLAQAPGGNYLPNQQTSVHMPKLYTWPYSNVHLQYRRWLAVEDSHFDHAQITANDRQVWLNATDNLGDASTLSHIDKEWRFHELPLSGYFRGRTLDVAWHLDSDAGVEMAGWSLDDVCIVASPNEICGDGKISTYEQCDDGSANADAPDACRTDCRTPVCGDGIVDSKEECDDGSAGSKGCTPDCKLIPVPPSGGCCDAGGAGGSLALGTIVIGALARRRRHFSRRGSRKSRERS
ncbi:MAG: hypothetical protein ACM31C_32390, partial [Acidobacteriota bacterium]